MGVPAPPRAENLTGTSTRLIGMRAFLVTAATAGAALLTACSSGAGSSPQPATSPSHSSASCTPRPGGRCPGPEPVNQALIGALGVDHTGRHLSGTFQCGGRLEVAETGGTVTVTYLASAVRPGAMMCARVPLQAALPTAAGHRTFRDGVTGATLQIAGR